MIAAGVHAFGAALALGRIDEDSELAAAHALLLEDGEVLVRGRPLGGHRLAFGFVGDLAQLLFEDGGSTTLPRMAVSGHWVTHSMQPTQFSVMNSGISGAM